MTHVNEVELVNDTIVRVHFDGEDNRSGIWKYALYVQYGRQDSWNEVAEMDSSYFDIRYYEDIDYGFCVLATDSAGNIEKKLIQREFSFLNGESRKEESTTFVDTKHTTNDIFPAYDLEGRLVQEERYRGNIIKNRKKILNR